MFIFETCQFWHKKNSKIVTDGNRPKKGDSMKMLLMAQNPFEEFRCSHSRIAPIGVIV